MSLRYFLTFLLVGALAGWLSGVLTNGRGFGVAGNMIVGIIGAFIGNYGSGLLGIYAAGFLGHLVFAVCGALLFAWLLRFIKR